MLTTFIHLRLNLGFVCVEKSHSKSCYYYYNSAFHVVVSVVNSSSSSSMLLLLLLFWLYLIVVLIFHAHEQVWMLNERLRSNIWLG